MFLIMNSRASGPPVPPVVAEIESDPAAQRDRAARIGGTVAHFDRVCGRTSALAVQAVDDAAVHLPASAWSGHHPIDRGGPAGAGRRRDRGGPRGGVRRLDDPHDHEERPAVTAVARELAARVARTRRI
ncbi:hypothetical protein [Geodermatophilus sp. URMC 63]